MLEYIQKTIWNKRKGQIWTQVRQEMMQRQKEHLKKLNQSAYFQNKTVSLL